MHGGDIYSNDIDLDFSVNLNPLGMPDAVRRAIINGAETTEHYPDPDYRRLRDVIGKGYGVAPGQIVCGNGASELIMGLCHAFFASGRNEVDSAQDRLSKALILAPGFSGYRRALSAVHADVLTMDLREENGWIPDDSLEDMIVREKPQLVLLSNPANPTGVLLPRERLISIARLCRDVGAVLCVDECFMELTDYASQDSLIRCCNAGSDDYCENLMVLNAITKSYAVPGVRLGYAFCGTEKMAIALKSQLPEWNVSTMAEAAGIAALRTGPEYLDRARKMIREERDFLQKELSAFRCHSCPSEANFILFYSSRDLYHALLEQKILIRDCSDYEGLGEGWYRIAVRCHEDNAQLIRIMKSFKSMEPVF